MAGKARDGSLVAMRYVGILAALVAAFSWVIAMVIIPSGYLVLGVLLLLTLAFFAYFGYLFGRSQWEWWPGELNEDSFTSSTRSLFDALVWRGPPAVRWDEVESARWILSPFRHIGLRKGRLVLTCAGGQTVAVDANLDPALSEAAAGALAKKGVPVFPPNSVKGGAGTR